MRWPRRCREGRKKKETHQMSEELDRKDVSRKILRKRNHGSQYYAYRRRNNRRKIS